MNNYTFKHYAKSQNEKMLADLLFAVGDELYLPDYASAQKVVSLCFDQGGVIASYVQGRLCGMMGYFRGDPARNFVNKEIAFLYVGAILKPFRGTHMFSRGLFFALKEFQAAGFLKIRLQAEETNPFTNRLYGRFARPLGKEFSLRGKPVITYGASVAEAIHYLETGRRPSEGLPPHAATHQAAHGNGHMAPLMINARRKLP